MPKSRPSPVFTEPAPAGSQPGGKLYVPTLAGFLSLAIVLDVFSRRIHAFAGTGWAMAGHLRTELGLNALDIAVEQRRPDPGLRHPPLRLRLHLCQARGGARRPAGAGRMTTRAPKPDLPDTGKDLDERD